MKKFLIATALATPLVFSNAKSFEFPEKLPFGDISANVGYYSQYIWRGERQNDGQSAIQGGLDYSATLLDTYIDFYVGVWGSYVSGGTNSLSGNELDYYGGLTGAVPFIEDYLSWDAGILYYDYPGMTDETSPTPDFVEIRNAGTPNLETTPFLSGENDVSPLETSFVVKPAREGSSFGISIVHPEGKTSLEDAMKEAIKYDDIIIVEAFVEGDEITVPILGEEILTPITIKPKNLFYDFEAKYLREVIDQKNDLSSLNEPFYACVYEKWNSGEMPLTEANTMCSLKFENN